MYLSDVFEETVELAAEWRLRRVFYGVIPDSDWNVSR